MCIHCAPLPSPSTPSCCLQAEPILPSSSLILLKRKRKK
jgi:hypothetical protein